MIMFFQDVIDVVDINISFVFFACKRIGLNAVFSEIL